MSKRFIDRNGVPHPYAHACMLHTGAWLSGEVYFRYLLIALMLVSALLLGACSSAPVKQAVTKPAPVSADIESGYALALDALRASQWQIAADRLTAITAQNDTLAGPWLNLGIARARLGATDQAEDALQQSIARNPDQPVAYNQLGILYREAGRYRDARKQYERALAVQPDYPDAHWNLGILYELYLQQPAQALAHYMRYQKITGADDPKLQLWIEQLQQATTNHTQTAGVRNP